RGVGGLVVRDRMVRRSRVSSRMGSIRVSLVNRSGVRRRSSGELRRHRRTGGRGKWVLIGLALVAVIALSIAGTAVVLKSDSGDGNGSTPSAQRFRIRKRQRHGPGEPHHRGSDVWGVGAYFPRVKHRD
ncbi:hypothetical protein ABH105_22775, partial [Mycolicibacterium smegmatis]|uniref:hypothetical protein n=1 Tax=Mycolicibacterium smegmatis TaxID=1772 RepID=UPI003260D61E